MALPNTIVRSCLLAASVPVGNGGPSGPLDGLPHPEAHLHWENHPAFRSPGRLKYLAGTEIGAGMFANEALPEAKAAELRAVGVDLT